MRAKPGPCFNELRRVGYTKGHWSLILLSFKSVRHGQKIHIGSNETCEWKDLGPLSAYCLPCLLGMSEEGVKVYDVVLQVAKGLRTPWDLF